jgi:ubiquinone/menaquinone biosynthesis C-methylase UbiE
MTNFDERAKDWDADPLRSERASAIAKAIRATLPLKSGMTAFEYGCGTGLLSFSLRQNFTSITLSDTSQGMLNVLSEKIEASGVDNMHPLKLDLTIDPLPDSRFDITYSLMTLHHIPEVDLVLQKLYELLLPNGRIYIADLDTEDGSFHSDSTVDVHKGFDRSALQKQVETAGFRDVSFSTVYEIDKLIGGVKKIFPVFLLTARRP